MTKEELRQHVRLMKSQTTAEERQTLSDAICDSILASDRWRDAQVVLLYHPLSDEVDVRPLLSRGLQEQKHLLLPRVEGDDLVLVSYDGTLQRGSFGISEPTGAAYTCLDDIDLAIVPGMAFDGDGHRLGRGRGYYDRLLPQLRAWRVGVCFPFQLFASVPHEEHDAVMNQIVTHF